MMSGTWAHGLGWRLLVACAGVALQLQQESLWPGAVYACLAALAWACAWFHTRWRFNVMRLMGWWLLAFAVTGLHALTRVDTVAPALEGRDLEVTGVVQALPQRQDAGWRFRFQIEQAWQSDPSGGRHPLRVSTDVPARVYLGWYPQDRGDFMGHAVSQGEPPKPGERWRFRVRLKAAHGHMNPRGFDYELWLWEQGIRATGYVRHGAKDPTPERLAVTSNYPVEAWRHAVRERLFTRLSAFSGDATGAQPAGIVAALVVGDQAAIDRVSWDVFRATGVAHLMSISGLHVTMFAWLASGLVAWVWRRSALWGFSGPLRWPAAQVGAVSGLLASGAYALFSGWGVPAQRTLWMLGVVVVLKLAARQWPKPLVWLLAAAVVVFLDPWAMLQTGFWLSFVAVGILMAAGPVTAAPLASTGWRWMGGLLREQATLTVALAPLTLLFFGQVSLVGLLANLVAIPWVTLVVTPLAMLGLVWSGFWVGAAWCLQPLSWLLKGLSAWPMASVSMAMPPWWLAVLGLAGALACVLPLPRSWKWLCLPLLWPVWFWSPARPEVGQFELLAADVGQGNAVLVRTATHSLLYDAGPQYAAESDAGHRVLVPLLAQMGERVDRLVLSHRDSDHTGGAAAVLAMQPQASLWSSLEDGHPLHARRADWTRCQAGQSWVWDGVRFEVLHPDAEQASLRPNALSCVVRIDNGQVSALLAGDIEAPQEAALVQAGLLPVDWLLVPHHGSKTSSTWPFLQALKPRVAVVQAGYRNRFGHPAAPVVGRYQDEGVALIETSRCGASLWQSQAPDQVRCERPSRQRYWHHNLPP
jgi:competence protein ComEC